jgi:hypothetical protein
VAQVLECLPSKHKALSSDPSTVKNTKTKVKIVVYTIYNMEECTINQSFIFTEIAG